MEVLKNDFDEVDEAMIQSVENPCQLIIYVQGIEKRYLDEVP
jgi:hypothetical protein